MRSAWAGPRLLGCPAVEAAAVFEARRSGRRVAGRPLKLGLTALVLGAVFAPSGWGPAAAIGFVATTAAHEFGHYAAAQAAGRSPVVHIGGWLAVTDPGGPVTRRIAAAGPIGSLTAGAVAGAIILMATGTAGQEFAAELLAGTPVIAGLDAASNLLTTPLLIAALGISAGVLIHIDHGEWWLWLVALAVFAPLAVYAARTGVRITDGDYFWRPVDTAPDPPEGTQP